MAPPLAEAALKFGPPEYFSLTVLGLLLATYLAGDQPLKGFMMAIMGLLLGCIGLDPISGAVRFAFGNADLQSNIDFVTVAMGLFGVGEILISLESTETAEIVTDEDQERLADRAPTSRAASGRWSAAR